MYDEAKYLIGKKRNKRNDYRHEHEKRGKEIKSKGKVRKLSNNKGSKYSFKR